MKLLTQMLDQFKASHQGQPPVSIVVEPGALAALSIKHSVAPVWNGIPVECREIRREECCEKSAGDVLGVLLHKKRNQVAAVSMQAA
jgi:hypothetical protein